MKIKYRPLTQFCKIQSFDKECNFSNIHSFDKDHAVDGRNPAPPGMYKTLEKMG